MATNAFARIVFDKREHCKTWAATVLTNSRIHAGSLCVCIPVTVGEPRTLGLRLDDDVSSNLKSFIHDTIEGNPP